MKHPRYFLLIAALAMVLAACGGDDSPQSAGTVPTVTPTSVDQSPTATPEPTVTEEPVVPTATIDPTATSEPAAEPPTATPTVDPTPTPTEEPEPTATPEPPATDVTDADLEQYLLTLQDMPLGWTFQPDSGSDDESSSDSEVCGISRPDDLPRHIASAEVDFQQSAVGPLLTHSVTLYETEEIAARVVEWGSSRFACGEDVVDNDDGTQTRITFAPLAFPTLGDDTFVVRMSLPVGFAGQMEVDGITVRSGRYLVQIQHFGLNGVDTQQSLEFIERALAKLP